VLSLLSTKALVDEYPGGEPYSAQNYLSKMYL